MKQLFSTAIAVCFCVAAYAQTEKGKIIVGGNVEFNTVKINSQFDQKITSLNLGPTIGLFVGKNTALGIGLNYNYRKEAPQQQINTVNGVITITEIGGSKYNLYGVSPFLRHYIDLHEKIKLFGELNSSFMFGKSEVIVPDGIYDNNTKMTIYRAGISPGITFFPHKKLAIEFKAPLFTYHGEKHKYENRSYDDTSTHQLSFGSDLNRLSLGVNFHF